MHRISKAALCAAVLSSRPVLGTVLTLDDALARARRESPAIVTARLRPDEALCVLARGSFVRHLRVRARNPRAAPATELEGLAEPRLDVG